jgi:large subunit ribosomal protein L3
LDGVILGEGLFMKIFASKIGMTHLYDQNGSHTPVTVLSLQKTVICGKKVKAKDGYDAVIVGLVNEKSKISKPLNGQFKKITGLARVIEDNTASVETVDEGTVITAESFKEGDSLSVFAKSKGKGFAGTVKRHGFNTGPKTHGSHNYRQPGSIGDTGPQHVAKGKKMSGHMGDENVTVKEVMVVRIEKDLNRIWVKGAIPGSNKRTIILQKND